MEALSNNLQPYKETVGSIASVITILQFFSGAVICLDIYKKKSTSGISAMPFIGGTVIGILVLKYAMMLQDTAMFRVNMAAIILNMIYVIFYLIYSDDKWTELYRPSIQGLALTSTLFAYLRLEDESKLEFRYGMIVTILMLLLMGAPLMEIRDIIENQDASSIPFPITFMGFFVSISWLIYGIILMNDFMIVQNLIGTLLCLVQLLLYFIYPTDKHLHED